MRLANVLLLVLISINTSFSQNEINNKQTKDTKFDEIKIGQQTWMKYNLNISTFRNGEPIPQARNKAEWKKYNQEKKPAWCFYDNDSKNQEAYGKLYNWYTVIDPRGLAPDGWHVPTDAEWSELTKNSGGQEMSGQFLKSTTGWERKGNGTDYYGFSIFPAGDCSKFMNFNGLGEYTYFWTSSEEYVYYAWARYFNCANSITTRIPIDKQFGFSVRCIKN
jgi:uncharacterized protein (TIGR02145 family)